LKKLGTNVYHIKTIYRMHVFRSLASRSRSHGLFHVPSVNLKPLEALVMTCKVGVQFSSTIFNYNRFCTRQYPLVLVNPTIKDTFGHILLHIAMLLLSVNLSFNIIVLKHDTSASKIGSLTIYRI